MAVFKFVVSDPKTKKAYQIEKDQKQCESMIGKKIGDTFSGDIIGLIGYELVITGGSDNSGFPMSPTIDGPQKRKVVIKYGLGMKKKKEGLRLRRTIRGNTISEEISQINCKVTKWGSKPIEELTPKKEEKKGD